MLSGFWPQGEYSRFQVAGMIKWGQKSKPKIIPTGFRQIPIETSLNQNLTHPKIPCQVYKSFKKVWLYFNHRTWQPGYASTPKNLQIVLNTPKNPYLNQAIRKNTCQNFLPKNLGIKNFKPKKSFNHPCHLKYGVPPWGSGMPEFPLPFECK